MDAVFRTYVLKQNYGLFGLSYARRLLEVDSQAKRVQYSKNETGPKKVVATGEVPTFNQNLLEVKLMEEINSKRKVKFVTAGKDNQKPEEAVFLFEDQESCSMFLKMFSGWNNSKGIQVLTPIDNKKIGSLIYKMSDSSKVAPFSVKIGLGGVSPTSKTESLPLQTPERQQLYIRRVQPSKTRNLFTQVLQKEAQPQMTPPDGSPTLSPNFREESRDKSTVEPIDFSKIMEEAKKKIGLMNWQRTESAKKRLRMINGAADDSMQRLDKAEIKEKPVDSDDESSEEEERSPSLKSIKQARTCFPNSRILIVPQEKVPIKPSTIANQDSLGKKLTLTIRPLRNPVTSYNSPTGDVGPISLQDLRTPKRMQTESFRTRLTLNINGSSKVRTSNASYNSNNDLTEQTPPMMQDSVRNSANQSIQPPLKRPIASRQLPKKVFSLRGDSDHLYALKDARELQ